VRQLSILGPFAALSMAAVGCLHNARATSSFSEYEWSQAAWHALGVTAVLIGIRKFPR